MEDELTRKYIVWIDYGMEGWKPTGVHSLEDAMHVPTYGSGKLITSGKITIPEPPSTPTSE